MSDDRQDWPYGVPQFNLLGKDWLTVLEAAHYCGVHPDTFAKKAAEYSLHPRNFMGKKLYEKAELYKVIYQSPQWPGSRSVTSTPLGSLGSPGRMDPGPALSRSVEEALERLRQPAKRTPRKKPKST